MLSAWLGRAKYQIELIGLIQRGFKCTSSESSKLPKRESNALLIQPSHLVHIYAYIHMHAYIYYILYNVYIYAYVYMYMCIYVCIYVYMYMCIHIYIKAISSYLEHPKDIRSNSDCMNNVCHFQTRQPPPP